MFVVNIIDFYSGWGSRGRGEAPSPSGTDGQDGTDGGALGGAKASPTIHKGGFAGREASLRKPR